MAKAWNLINNFKTQILLSFRILLMFIAIAIANLAFQSNAWELITKDEATELYVLSYFPGFDPEKQPLEAVRLEWSQYLETVHRRLPLEWKASKRLLVGIHKKPGLVDYAPESVKEHLEFYLSGSIRGTARDIISYTETLKEGQRNFLNETEQSKNKISEAKIYLKNSIEYLGILLENVGSLSPDLREAAIEIMKKERLLQEGDTLKRKWPEDTSILALVNDVPDNELRNQLLKLLPSDAVSNPKAATSVATTGNKPTQSGGKAAESTGVDLPTDSLERKNFCGLAQARGVGDAVSAFGATKVKQRTVLESGDVTSINGFRCRSVSLHLTREKGKKGKVILDPETSSYVVFSDGKQYQLKEEDWESIIAEISKQSAISSDPPAPPPNRGEGAT